MPSEQREMPMERLLLKHRLPRRAESDSYASQAGTRTVIQTLGSIC